MDARLLACARLCKGDVLCDVGTDHGYLPCYMIENGLCKKAFACDVAQGPLNSAIAHIKERCLSDKITAVLSDGLDGVEKGDITDVVVAGMGGELIAKILSECSFANDSSKHFILQPMTKSEVLIAWLCENGFKILKQDCCVASGKCYTVLLVKYSGEKHSADELYCYLGELSPKNNETHLRFVESHLSRLSKQAVGDVRFAVLADKIREKTYDND